MARFSEASLRTSRPTTLKLHMKQINIPSPEGSRKAMSRFSERYYILCIILPNDPAGFNVHPADRSVSISPNLRLSTSKEARLESKGLAEKFLETCLPIFKNRYGKDIHVFISEVFFSPQKRFFDRIAKDSELVKARLAEGKFSPTWKP